MSSLDPVLLAVLANRVDGVVREMENTLLRTGRSAVLAMARDFSCSLVTGDDRLLSSGEGLPVHVFGSELLTEAMHELHDDIAPGDAFLHNDPYRGNTHAADHTILVPVFWEGEHVFTAVAKAHQADIGNGLPTTYTPFARDVYEEGALVFPCVRVQREHEDVGDVIRSCRARIRVPDQWYGDYLAMVGAARIAERRLHGLMAEHGAPTVEAFVEEWFDYSERRMAHAISELPAGSFVGEGHHDPLPTLEHLPDGVPVRVAIAVDPEERRIEVDLRENIDCVDAGINESRACSTNNVMTGVFNSLDVDIPHNAGSFRRVDVRLRENCLVGIPRFPHSCSVATTNVGERLVVTTQRAFAEAVEGRGLAEGACGIGPGFSVISGQDDRRENASYVNQMFLGSQGGPGGPRTDGWITYGNAVTNGLMFRDSVEVDEQKYPIRIEELRVRPDSEGAGRRRGAPGTVVRFGPKGAGDERRLRHRRPAPSAARRAWRRLRGPVHTVPAGRFGRSGVRSRRSARGRSPAASGSGTSSPAAAATAIRWIASPSASMRMSSPASSPASGHARSTGSRSPTPTPRAGSRWTSRSPLVVARRCGGPRPEAHGGRAPRSARRPQRS